MTTPLFIADSSSATATSLAEAVGLDQPAKDNTLALLGFLQPGQVPAYHHQEFAGTMNNIRAIQTRRVVR